MTHPRHRPRPGGRPCRRRAARRARSTASLLGLEELAKPEALQDRGGCWFRAGAHELHVGVEDPFAPARKAHPGFVVDDLAALSDRLRGAGIAVERDDTIPGVERAYVADPFGNRLELRQA